VTPRILVETSPGEARVALAEGGRLIDYALWRPGAPDGVGDLHRGRVTARVPAMAGAFVALACGQHGFLPDSHGGAEASEGIVLAVRVTRGAQGGKGPRLTARLSDEEAAAFAAVSPSAQVALLRRGPDAVRRLAAAYPDAPVLADDPALAAGLRPALGERVALCPAPVFDEAIAEQVAALAEPWAALPGGARASFHPTPALTAIDIDSGAATAERTGKAAAQAALNRGAVAAIAAQIRLRNLSGAILLDLAGMPARKRAGIGPELAAALALDPLRPRLLGFTALGLAEIVRPRIHPPLHELLAGPHAAALAALRAASAEGVPPGHRLTLRAPASVVAALDRDPEALDALSRRLGHTVSVVADAALPGLAWTLYHDAKR
jgi:Ribonuclease G/E